MQRRINISIPSSIFLRGERHFWRGQGLGLKAQRRILLLASLPETLPFYSHLPVPLQKLEGLKTLSENDVALGKVRSILSDQLGSVGKARISSLSSGIFCQQLAPTIVAVLKDYAQVFSKLNWQNHRRFKNQLRTKRGEIPVLLIPKSGHLLSDCFLLSSHKRIKIFSPMKPP